MCPVTTRIFAPHGCSKSTPARQTTPRPHEAVAALSANAIRSPAIPRSTCLRVLESLKNEAEAPALAPASQREASQTHFWACLDSMPKL